MTSMPSAVTTEALLNLSIKKRRQKTDAHRYDWYNLGSDERRRCKRPDQCKNEQGHTLHARPKQRPPPGDWFIWLIRTGRKWGKTRTAAQWVNHMTQQGVYGRWAFVSETAADCRDIMVEGESGILATSPPWFYPHYEPSKRRITWPNGAMATMYSAEEPNQLRGPTHDCAWCDELAKWPKLHRKENAWSNLLFGLTLGPDPRAIVTTTPRPLALLKELRSSPTTVLVRGHTKENLRNLAPAVKREIIGRYEGTRLGLQELAGEELEDVEGALWTRTLIDEYRVSDYPSLSYIVVGVDPAASDTETSSETGIVGAGLGDDGDIYVLHDGSRRGSPHEWASAALSCYNLLEADRIIVEANQGGDMVVSTLRTVVSQPDHAQNISIRKVHASRGKRTRAEPIAALYEQGRVHHVGFLPELEEQLCNWSPVEAVSPDRLDAMVWALTELSTRRVGKLPEQTTTPGRLAGLSSMPRDDGGSRLAGLPGRIRGG